MTAKAALDAANDTEPGERFRRYEAVFVAQFINRQE